MTGPGIVREEGEVTKGTGDEQRTGSLTVRVERFSTGIVVVRVAGELLAAVAMPGPSPTN